MQKKWRLALKNKVVYPLYEIEFDSENSIKFDSTWLTLGDTLSLFQGEVFSELYWKGMVSENPKCRTFN